MKRTILLTSAMLMCVMIVAANMGYNTSATCTGSKSCKACKNCKYCKHCAKDGGKCGVCK